MGLYTERPSINTRTLSANTSLKPRMLMAQVLVLIWATFKPGTMRKTSGILVAPDRRMSSCVITKTAAPAFERALFLLGYRSHL